MCVYAADTAGFIYLAICQHNYTKIFEKGKYHVRHVFCSTRQHIYHPNTGQQWYTHRRQRNQRCLDVRSIEHVTYQLNFVIVPEKASPLRVNEHWEVVLEFQSRGRVTVESHRTAGLNNVISEDTTQAQVGSLQLPLETSEFAADDCGGVNSIVETLDVIS